MKFKCYDCDVVFEAKGKKKEFVDPVYGPCSKWVAKCPECKVDASEYNPPLEKGKSSRQMPSCGMEGGCASCSYNH